jgi:hypothetical protein
VHFGVTNKPVRRLVACLVAVLAFGLVAFAAPSLAQAESLEITPGTEPTQDVPLSIKVSGVADGHHKLYVFVNTYTGCSSTPEYDDGSSLASGTTLSAGSFEKTYSYTPTSVQTYTLCAYLDENEFASPDVTAEGSFAAAMPGASAAIEISGKLTQNIPMKIKVAGTTEVARKLYVFVNTYTDCSSTPEYDDGSSLASGTSLMPGAYSGEYSYTPTSTQTYTVCGYVDESEFATPDATGTSSFTNVTPKTRAEEAEKSAEQAAYAADRAAEVKKEQEAAAKQKYEEEAPARKAAKEAAEEAKYAAEVAAAKARAHKTPVKHLSVKAAAHDGHSSSDPGYTNLDITTSPYAHVVVKLSRYGHSTEHFEWGSHSTEVAEVIRWSCKSPGGTYRYVITAKSNVGLTLTRRGDFTPVSVSTCHQYEQREAEARARHEREVLAGYEQEVREERERLQAYEANCRAEGGTPVTLTVEGRTERYCRGPYGGLLPVPH